MRNFLKKNLAVAIIAPLLLVGLPVTALAASFGTQNFFYAPGNTITPLPGYTTSWSGAGGIAGVPNGGTGWGNLQANTILLGNGTGKIATTSNLSIGLGGTATTTGGVTNGLEFYNGTNLTNGASLTTDGLGNLILGGNQWYLMSSSTKSNSFIIGDPLLANQFLTLTTGGLLGIGTTTPSAILDVATGNINVDSPYNIQKDNLPFVTASSTEANLFVGMSVGTAGIAAATSTSLTSLSQDIMAGTGVGSVSNLTSSQGKLVAFGFSIMNAGGITTAQQDVGFGGSIFGQLTSGSFNAAVGVLAAQDVTSGGSNVFFGEQAGQQLTNGSNNTYLGVASGEWNQTGASNVVIGQNAAFGSGSVNSNNNNTIVGQNAARVITTGSNNIVIGQNAASTTDSVTMTRNIIIGHDIAPPTANANATGFLDIGNDIFGTGLNSQGSSTPSGNIGIASSSPTATLGVGGTVSALLTTFSTGDSAVCQRGAGGLLTVDAGISSCIVSSQYVKHDITSVTDTAALERIMALNPVSFVYDDTGQPDIGLIAEQVAKVDPRYAQYTTVTRTDANGHTFKPGDPAGVNWSAITADSAVVIKDQELRLEALEKQGTVATSDTENYWQWLVMFFLAVWCLGLTFALIRRP